MMKKLSDYRFLVGSGVKALMAKLSAKKKKITRFRKRERDIKNKRIKNGWL